MRILILALASSVLFSGCAKIKSWLPSGPKKASISTSKPLITPAASDSGKISMVNANARFVVMTFPISGVPAIGTRLDVYRAGAKVAQVKVTGPQHDGNTVGDILSGEPMVNDDVRAD